MLETKGTTAISGESVSKINKTFPFRRLATDIIGAGERLVVQRENSVRRVFYTKVK